MPRRRRARGRGRRSRRPGRKGTRMRVTGNRSLRTRVMRVPYSIPDKFINVMHTSIVHTFTGDGTNSLETTSLELNNVFDLQAGGGTAQPRGYDALKFIWNHYEVTRGYVRFTFINNNVTKLWAWCRPSFTTFTPDSGDAQRSIRESDKMSRRILFGTANTTSPSTVSITTRARTRSILPTSTKEGRSADVDVDPVDKVFVTFGVLTLDNVAWTSAQTVTVIADIYQTVVWTEPKHLALSTE